jgi:hypothetical protein
MQIRRLNSIDGIRAEKAAIAGTEAKARALAAEMGTLATQLGCQQSRDASNSRNDSNRKDANSSKHIGDRRADCSIRNTGSWLSPSFNLLFRLLILHHRNSFGGALHL